MWQRARSKLGSNSLRRTHKDRSSTQEIELIPEPGEEYPLPEIFSRRFGLYWRDFIPYTIYLRGISCNIKFVKFWIPLCFVPSLPNVPQDPLSFVNSLEYEAHLRHNLWWRIVNYLPEYRHYMLVYVWPYLMGNVIQAVVIYDGSHRGPGGGPHNDDQSHHRALTEVDWPEGMNPRVLAEYCGPLQEEYFDVKPQIEYGDPSPGGSSVSAQAVDNSVSAPSSRTLPSSYLATSMAGTSGPITKRTTMNAVVESANLSDAMYPKV